MSDLNKKLEAVKDRLVAWNKGDMAVSDVADEAVETVEVMLKAMEQIVERSSDAKQFADPGSYNENLGIDVLRIVSGALATPLPQDTRGPR